MVPIFCFILILQVAFHQACPETSYQCQNYDSSIYLQPCSRPEMGQLHHTQNCCCQDVYQNHRQEVYQNHRQNCLPNQREVNLYLCPFENECACVSKTTNYIPLNTASQSSCCGYYNPYVYGQEGQIAPIDKGRGSCAVATILEGKFVTYGVQNLNQCGARY